MRERRAKKGKGKAAGKCALWEPLTTSRGGGFIERGGGDNLGKEFIERRRVWYLRQLTDHSPGGGGLVERIGKGNRANPIQGGGRLKSPSLILAKKTLGFWSKGRREKLGEGSEGGSAPTV